MKSILNIAKAIATFFFVIVCAAAFTLVLFLVLPFMQSIGRPSTESLRVQSVDVAELPPPPPPPEEEPEEEPEEPDDEPPELAEETPLLDLAQLELALNTGPSDGWMSGDFTVRINTAAARGEDVDSLFSLADLDQQPRVMHQPSPVLSARLRNRTPATVYVIFVVDQNGRVQNPIVQQSTDPAFDEPTVSAVKQWRFEPGKRSGNPVRFRMRVPITYPKDS